MEKYNTIDLQKQLENIQQDLDRLNQIGIALSSEKNAIDEEVKKNGKQTKNKKVKS